MLNGTHATIITTPISNAADGECVASASTPAIIGPIPIMAELSVANSRTWVSVRFLG